MRFAPVTIGRPSVDPYDARWRSLHQPDAELAHLLTFPLAFVAGTAVLVLWLVLAPFAPVRPEFVQLITVFAVLVPLHELTHAATFPRGTGAGRTTIAFSLRGPRLSAEYDGTLSQARLVTTLLMPMIVISLLPVLATALLGRASTSLALLSLINAVVSSGDLLVAILVLAQVPPAALVRIKGGEILWQVPAAGLSFGPPRTAHPSG